MSASTAPISTAALLRSPAWFPLDVVGPQAVRLLHLDEAAYRDSSFLDQRLLHAGHARLVLAPAQLKCAAAQLAPRLHYIFHIGHVGSTLVSRLLGAQEQLFALREPALLRALAEGTLSAQLPAAELSLRDILALLARTWRPGQRAVVKVSSFVSEWADPLLESSEQAAALFMFAEPLTYLRTIFAGANSRAESRLLAPLRLRRLLRRLGASDWGCDPRSEGEEVAMSWLCEMMLPAAGRARSGRADPVGKFRSVPRWPARCAAGHLRAPGGAAGAAATREPARRTDHADLFKGPRACLRRAAASRTAATGGSGARCRNQARPGMAAPGGRPVSGGGRGSRVASRPALAGRARLRGCEPSATTCAAGS